MRSAWRSRSRSTTEVPTVSSLPPSGKPQAMMLEIVNRGVVMGAINEPPGHIGGNCRRSERWMRFYQCGDTKMRSSRRTLHARRGREGATRNTRGTAFRAEGTCAQRKKTSSLKMTCLIVLLSCGSCICLLFSHDCTPSHS